MKYDIATLVKILGVYIVAIFFTMCIIVYGVYVIVYPNLPIPALVTSILGGALVFATTLIGVQVGVPLVNGTTIATISKAQNNIGSVSNNTPTDLQENTIATKQNTTAVTNQTNGVSNG